MALLPELRERLHALEGNAISDVEVAMGEIDIAFGVTCPRLVISAVNWQLTGDGALIASSFTNRQARQVKRKLANRLVGESVRRATIHDSCALAVRLGRGLVLNTLPLADRDRQARLGHVQWVLEGPDEIDFAVTGWGELVSSRHDDPIGEPDFLRGHRGEERDLLAAAVRFIGAQYDAKVIADGTAFRGPDVILANDEGARFAIEAKSGALRRAHVDQLLRWTSDPNSPAYAAHPILVVEHAAAAEMDAIAREAGLRILAADDLRETR
jgi:hypothetical protein